MLLYIIFAVLVGHITCQSRIRGGHFAIPGEFPFQVSLQVNGDHICGGVIISETYILTAAHCTIGKDPLEMKALVGTTDLWAADGQTFDVAALIIHPLYTTNSYDYDISLIRLKKAMPLGTLAVDKIKILNPKTLVPANTKAVVSGFGSINRNKVKSHKLKFAFVPLWSPDLCNPEYDPNITSRMLCAGSPSGQENSCDGDSGGPLIVGDELVGLVSWGPGCGKRGPAKYTNVVAFREWIKQHSGVE